MALMMALVTLYAYVVIDKDHKEFQSFSGTFLVVIACFTKGNFREPQNATLQVGPTEICF